MSKVITYPVCFVQTAALLLLAAGSTLLCGCSRGGSGGEHQVAQQEREQGSGEGKLHKLVPAPEVSDASLGHGQKQPVAGADQKPLPTKIDSGVKVEKKDDPVKPPVLAKEIKNKLGMALVLIPKGMFKMGSPAIEEGREPKDKGSERLHDVEITKPFYMGKFEVTKGEFAAFVRAKSWPNAGTGATDRHPVATVSWEDAVAFCEWLSQKEGKKYRLPTEAEWEYSCRAHTKTRFHSGEDEASLKKVANYWESGPNSIPVGTLEANAFGLHDMHGNVWEWCQDWYATDYNTGDKQDPQGPSAGAARVLRGGSWRNQAFWCRAAAREAIQVADPGNDIIGFRVVCVP
jgi:formylglycine-generating enzyme required for sulfatase activity